MPASMMTINTMAAMIVVGRFFGLVSVDIYVIFLQNLSAAKLNDYYI